MTFASPHRWMRVFASCAGLSLASSGCIATDTIEFDPDQNFPPSVVSQVDADYPLNRIGQLNLDDPRPPEEPPEIALQTIVRDPNFDQTLQFRIFLDSPDPPASDFPILDGDIGPTGFLEREPVFAIPFDFLTPGTCHRIELVVVGQFASFVEPRRPVEPGDFDEATWWIEVTDDDNPIITEACR